MVLDIITSNLLLLKVGTVIALAWKEEDQMAANEGQLLMILIHYLSKRSNPSLYFGSIDHRTTLYTS